jgi:hypothetical protein
MALGAEAIAALEERLARYLEAEAAVLRNQSYEMPDGRSVTRANLRDIRAGIAEICADLELGAGKPVVRGRARRGVVMS